MGAVIKLNMGMKHGGKHNEKGERGDSNCLGYLLGGAKRLWGWRGEVHADSYGHAGGHGNTTNDA